MRACHYCGHQNENSARSCHGCGAVLSDEAAGDPGPRSGTPGGSRLLKPGQLARAFSRVDGFSRPDLPLIQQMLRPCQEHRARAAAWNEVITSWTDRWELELGGGYWLARSKFFILLSELDGEAAERTLQKANWMAQILRGVLGPMAWEGCPQILIVIISDEMLASRFERAVQMPEPLSDIQRTALDHAPCWMLLNEADESGLARLIEMALVSSCHSHLRLPRWLQLGLETQLRRALSDSRSEAAPPLSNPDLIPNHRRFWFEDTIQTLWAGTCPIEHPEYADLFFELCNVLVYLLAEKRRDMTGFLRCASESDAGQAAAQVCLQLDLGELAGSVLGPGHWAPDPLAIVECWERAREIQSR